MTTADQHDATTTRRIRLSRVVLANVVLLTMIAPLATDMYVPAFPRVGSDLHATATQVQLTLTTFFVGMALGQLVGGPVSDQRGRRRPLLGSIVLMVLASAVCALSPTIGVMMVARLVQGLAGGWAMVIARSVVVDLTSGPRLVRSLNLVQGVAGVAPIVGPLVGALVLQLSHWRVSFWLLAGWAVAMLVAVAVSVPESLPDERRHGGGLGQLRRSAGAVLVRPGFAGHLVVMACSMGVTFAYVATSAFVLQSMNGLSPVAYSLDFAANAVGLTVATLVAARLAGRVPTRSVVAVGLLATGAAGILLIAGAAWFDMPLGVAIAGFFVLMSAQGLVGPNAGALASAAVPEHPGTGSAVLGFCQWCTAGLVAPIAGLGGEQTAVPMATIVLVLVAVSVAALRLAARDVATAPVHHVAEEAAPCGAA
ncbi:multidrug effflux MFS transporter [Nocardioides sp. Soil805]|uniref:multidrug effflux MFS transporter n=1 Tax=Nocardioides sp. Soil805 TaxID=1736416 RepID=UPI00070318E8|nr:multidrug effflux MFS transporter [Nocardioides sp. Soil805]KRF34133.1 multidrug transporter CflA [Nocardioides sp. Soil805]